MDGTGGEACKATSSTSKSRHSERVDALLAEALELRGAGDYDRALALTSKALFLDKDCLDSLRFRAETYLEVGDLASAIANYRRCIGIDPDDVELVKKFAALLALQGNHFLASEDYDCAFSFFDEAVKLDGGNSSYWLYRGLAYVQLRQWRNALYDIDHCILINSLSADVFVLRAKLRWLLGMSALGNDDFKRAHQLQPDHKEVQVFERMLWEQADTIYRQAAQQLLMHNFSAAIHLLNGALELNPNDVKVRVLRASAYRRRHHYEEALRDLDEASRVFQQQQKHLREEQMFNKIRSSSSPPMAEDHAEITRQRNLTLNDMAVEKFSQENYYDAITLFNQVIESESRSQIAAAVAREGGEIVNSSFFTNRGDCYRKLGLIQQALADYHIAFDMDPENWHTKTRLALVHNEFGTRLFNASEYAQAEVEFSTAITHNPKVPNFWLNRANARFYQQKFKEEHADLTQVLRMDPRNEKALKMMQKYRQKKQSATAGGPGMTRSLMQPSQSAPSLKPSKLPKKLQVARDRERKAQRSLSRLQVTPCDLRDPLIGILHAARPNPLREKKHAERLRRKTKR
eukprot:g3344.t1